MIVLIILGALLQLLGLVGCVLPYLAGPPFNFIGLILLTVAKDMDMSFDALIVAALRQFVADLDRGRRPG